MQLERFAAVICSMFAASCVEPFVGFDPVGTTGSGGSSQQSGATSSAISSGTGGSTQEDPCHDCPVSTDPCVVSACVDEQCLFQFSEAGTRCGNDVVCNGLGLCDARVCESDLDCGSHVTCYASSCDTYGNSNYKHCSYSQVTSEECPSVCVPVARGTMVDMCEKKMPGTQAFYCDLPNGPKLGPICDRPDPATSQEAWCCALTNP